MKIIDVQCDRNWAVEPIQMPLSSKSMHRSLLFYTEYVTGDTNTTLRWHQSLTLSRVSLSLRTSTHECDPSTVGRSITALCHAFVCQFAPSEI